MDLRDTFKYLVGAYYGVREVDEYTTKEYILKDIEEYIKDFISSNPIDDFNYEEEARILEDELSLKTKLQDSLIVLPKVNAPMEIILLVKKRLVRIREEELEEM